MSNLRGNTLIGGGGSSNLNETTSFTYRILIKNFPDFSNATCSRINEKDIPLSWLYVLLLCIFSAVFANVGLNIQKLS